MGCLCTCMSMYHVHAKCLWKPEEELRKVLSLPMGTGNQTQLLWKSNKYTYLLRHLSSLFVNSFLSRGRDLWDSPFPCYHIYWSHHLAAILFVWRFFVISGIQAPTAYFLVFRLFFCLHFCDIPRALGAGIVLKIYPP